MTTYRGFSTRQTPQSEPIPGSGQVANSAGGYSYELDIWAKLDRFLILGTEGGTFYIREKELTKQNAEAVIECIKSDGPRTVNRIATISHEGRALKNDPALFALAMCFAFGNTETKNAAKAQLPQVARIGTHLFHFAQYVEQFRGWGRALKGAVAQWYDQREGGSLAYQLVKYQQRDGWGHADLIKLSHPKAHADLYNWVLGERPDTEGRKHEPVVKPGAFPEYPVIQGMVTLHSEFQNGGETSAAVKHAAQIIRDNRLPREAVPTAFLNKPEIWEALMDTDMGLEAMVRNLGNMGKVGLLTPLSNTAKKVVERLADGEALRRARLHPLKVLVALRQYSEGHGMRGDNKWDVVPQVKDALNAAFYESFKHVEPTGKNIMLALDVSGSMSSPMMGLNLRYCEGTAVMAMVTARVEQNYVFVGFCHQLKDLGITAADTLESATRKARDNNFGGTDCALPILGAQEKGLPIEVFCVYTDSETWAGRIHPSQALKEYRQKTGTNAKLVVIGMAANPFTIADPKDAGMLDVVGFDSDTPSVIAEFSRN